LFSSLSQTRSNYYLGSMFASFLFVAILWPCSKTHAFNIGDIVDTTSGRVQGRASALRPDVSEYLGIPYAEPPIGGLRFAAPVAVNASTTTLNATTYVRLHALINTVISRSLTKLIYRARECGFYYMSIFSELFNSI
jgi:hypothetical protein